MFNFIFQIQFCNINKLQNAQLTKIISHTKRSVPDFSLKPVILYTNQGF